MKIRSVPAVSSMGWPAWSATLLTVGLLGAICAWWALQLAAPRPLAAPAHPIAQAEGAGPGAATRLFGDPSAGNAVGRRSESITVIGVVSGGARGSAILSIDGKPAKAYAVGDRIDATTSLLSVDARQVVIGSPGRRIELEAPARTDPAMLQSGPKREVSLAGPAERAGR
jgi:general secretion pathway protein C